jgi:hypothetical protein
MSILIQLCFLAFQAFVGVASPSCNSPLFPFKLTGDELGVEKIQNFYLEEKGEKKRDLAPFQEAKEEKEGRDRTYFFAAILSFLGANEVGIVLLAGLAISASWIL